MSIKLTFFLTLICTNFIFAQSTSTISRSNSVIWSGTLPSRLSSGPMDVSFSVEYHFARNPTTNELILHYKIRNIKYDYRYSELRFKQDDVIYRPNDLDKIDGLKSEGFDDIDITSLKANVDVSSTGGGPSFSASNVSLSSHYLNRIVGNNISKDLILNNLTISFNQLDDLSFTNTTKLRNRINNSKNATTAKKSGSYTSKSLVVASSSETKTSKNSTATKSDKKDEKKTTTSDYSNYVPEKTKEQQVTELVQSGNQLLNNIAADMEATRIKNEATAKRERERRARNASAGKALLAKNLANAFNGKEDAVEKSYMGYMNIDKRGTEEGNDKDAIKFLEDVFQKNNSSFAKAQLIKDYSRTISFYDSERKRRNGRALLHAGVGGGLIAGSLSSIHYISSDDVLGEDIGPIAATAFTLFGGYMVMSGVMNAFRAGDYSKSSNDYKEAKKRIESLKKTATLSFAPHYNIKHNSLMVGLKLAFN